jgi:hypothetical protein
LTLSSIIFLKILIQKIACPFKKLSQLNKILRDIAISDIGPDPGALQSWVLWFHDACVQCGIQILNKN